MFLLVVTFLFFFVLIALALTPILPFQITHRLCSYIYIRRIITHSSNECIVYLANQSMSLPTAPFLRAPVYLVSDGGTTAAKDLPLVLNIGHIK